MSQELERRSDETMRVPLSAEVEVGASLGPAFDATAINVSETGMALKTAYLPEIGQRLTCSFDVDGERSVLVTGEVVWAHGDELGGEFGIRFDEIDEKNQELLHRFTRGMSLTTSKVRLFIDGLAKPMRMNVKHEAETHMVVESELAFLKMGRPLELEDAGLKRPAIIDKVAVEVTKAQVPQLVVSLKYEDLNEEEGAMDRNEMAMVDAGEEASMETMNPNDEPMEAMDDVSMGPADEEVNLDEPSMSASAAETHLEGDMDDEIEAESEKFKSPFLKKAEELKPVLDGLFRRAKTTAKLLAEKSFAKKGESTPRRVTAPAPSGGLHANGRRVVRGGTEEEAPKKPSFRMTRKNITIGAGAMALVLFGAVALKKSPSDTAESGDKTADKGASTTQPVENVNGAMVFPDQHLGGAETTQAAVTQPALPQTPPQFGAGTVVGPAGLVPPEAPGAVQPLPADKPTLANQTSVGSFEEPTPAREERPTHAQAKVLPFGDKGLTHGNVLKLKMDGPIDAIQGAPQGTGFTVVIPHRRAVEPASPLVARDARLDAMKVTNEPNGAELSVSFNDSVPNYVVRAKGDTLEIVLARPKATDATHKSVAKAPAAHETKRPHKTRHKKK